MHSAGQVVAENNVSGTGCQQRYPGGVNGFFMRGSRPSLFQVNIKKQTNKQTNSPTFRWNSNRNTTRDELFLRNHLA